MGCEVHVEKRLLTTLIENNESRLKFESSAAALDGRARIIDATINLNTARDR